MIINLFWRKGNIKILAFQTMGFLPPYQTSPATSTVSTVPPPTNDVTSSSQGKLRWTNMCSQLHLYLSLRLHYPLLFCLPFSFFPSLPLVSSNSSSWTLRVISTCFVDNLAPLNILSCWSLQRLSPPAPSSQPYKQLPLLSCKHLSSHLLSSQVAAVLAMRQQSLRQ